MSYYSEISASMSLASMCASPLVASSELIAGGGGGNGAEDDQIVAVNRNTGSVVRRVSNINYHFP